MAAPESVWRLAMRHSPLGMTVIDVAGTLLLVNDAFCRMVGRAADELVQMDFALITHPEDREPNRRDFFRTARGERESHRIEKRYLHADGSTVWGDLSVVLVRDDDGNPEFLVAQVVDITASQRDRQRLTRVSAIAERERLIGDAILDSVDVGLVLLRDDGVYERMNRRHREFLLLAYPDGHDGRAGQVGLVFGEHGTPLGGEEMPSARAVAGEEFDDLRIWVGDDPLTRRALAVSARSVRDDGGVFVGAALAYVDVTALVTALEVQQTFLGTVSHELRTPLTSILGHLELLEDSGDPQRPIPAEVAGPLAVIHRNARRLDRLVRDVLEETGRAGGLPLELREADLGALAVEAAESAALSATEAGVALVVETSGELGCLVDVERVRQVLDNLIANAVKYTDPGGRVVLSCHDVPGPRRKVVVSIGDSGIGIPSVDLARVFTPFFRSREAVERHVSGLGLGLGVVQRIIDAHGGQISVDSEVGRGTTVRVELPARG